MAHRKNALVVSAVAATAAVCGASAAALMAQGTLTLRINDKPAPAPIEREGEFYVSVNALRAAGADVTLLGETLHVRFLPAASGVQKEVQEGRPGEWVGNGVWRVRVTEVKPFSGGTRAGVDVTLEVFNASDATRSVAPALTSARIRCVDAKGVALEMGALAASGLDAFLEKKFLPAGQASQTLRFFYPAGQPLPDEKKPGKLTLGFSATAAETFPVKEPTLSVFLAAE